MRLLTFLCAVCIVAPAFGQPITVTSLDMPNVGDTMKISTLTDPGNFDPSITDTNYTWDFTNWEYFAQEDEIHLTVAQTNLLYNIDFGAIAPVDYQADYGVTAPDQVIGPITISDRYDFYKYDVNSFRLLGYGANLGGLPTGVPYDVIDTIHNFPLNYGDVDSNWVKVTATLPIIGDYISEGQRRNEVIGWGLVKTPFGNFNCLHVESVLDLIDTIAGSPQIHPIIEHRWVTNGEGIPIVYVINDQLFSPLALQIFYKDILRPHSDFTVDVDSVCVNENVEFTEASAGNVDTWVWDFGADANPPTDTGAGPHMVSYGTSGFKTVSLTVSSADGSHEEIKTNLIEIAGCVGINEFDLEQQVVVYPNPASEYLTLSFPVELDLTNVSLFDMQGRHVRDFGQPTSSDRLSTAGLIDGNYVLRVIGNNEVASKRISIIR